MKKYDLSILIPARNEMFVSNTVKDILRNKRGNTEIIVGLDGAWAEPGIADHPDVKMVYVSKSRGQRGMTNTLARLSTAKYLAKSDAHCAFDEGFDVKLMEAIKGHDDWTVVPTMCNLHAFDWKCMKCGKRTYQGPTPGTDKQLEANGGRACSDCDNKDDFQRKIIFQPRVNTPHSTAFCFDPEPHFQYFNQFKRRPEGQGDVTPTMSLQGSFFLLTREKYWSLKICDEELFGSWGSQGIEVACKTWLTGGQVMCVQTTWYAHLFRTQGGDFSFPYDNPQSRVDTAKKKAREVFFQGAIPGQLNPLSWLVEKFWPVQGWKDEDLAELKKLESREPTKGILYFTDNQLTLKVARPVQKRIKQIAKELEMELVSSSRKPMDMGKNVTTRQPKGYLTMFKQILKGLEAMESDIVFMAEHDVIYPKEHFEFTPKDREIFYYDQNWYKYHLDDGLIVTWDADQVSGLCAYRETLIKHYRERIKTFDRETFDRKFEPGSGVKSEAWKAAVSYVDIRTGQNLTLNKRSLDDFRNKSSAKNFQVVDKIPGWGDLSDILKQ